MAVRHVGFLKTGNFNGQCRVQGIICISVPNLAAIDQTVAVIWQFFDFEDGGVLTVRNFNDRQGGEGQSASPCQILRHLGIVMPKMKQLSWSLSLCKVWLESMQYRYFR